MIISRSAQRSKRSLPKPNKLIPIKTFNPSIKTKQSQSLATTRLTIVGRVIIRTESTNITLANPSKLLGTLAGAIVRATLSRRLSRRLNCSGRTPRNHGKKGSQGKAQAGAILASGYKPIRVAIPHNHSNAFRPRLIHGQRQQLSSLSRLILSLCTGKLAAKRVSTRLTRICKTSISGSAVDQVASQILRRVGT